MRAAEVESSRSSFLERFFRGKIGSVVRGAACGVGGAFAVVGRARGGRLFGMVCLLSCALALPPAAQAQTVTATLGVGTTPHVVAVNPVTNKIYVANLGSDTVSVIDGATNQVIASPTVGTNPQAVAVNPVTDKVYVANDGDSTVSVIDGATNQATNVIVGTNPQAVTVNPVTNQI